MEPGTGYLVMASHLPLTRITATVRFFWAVSAVRRQLAAAEGLIGYTLRAKPLARDYWTLSVWTDDTALRQFMRTPPHVQGDDIAQALHGINEVRHLAGLRSRWPPEHGSRPGPPGRRVARLFLADPGWRPPGVVCFLAGHGC